MSFGDRTHFFIEKNAKCGHIIRLTYNLRLTKTVKEYIMSKDNGKWGSATKVSPNRVVFSAAVIMIKIGRLCKWMIIGQCQMK